MDPIERHELYRTAIMNAVPRMLSELDRDPFSTTYGCFDREYWAWATKDFSNVDLQRAIYPMTILYLQPFSGNFWCGKTRVKDWILAAFRFWLKCQHKNGSHDHHYPNEYSFVGAAFPLYEISEAYRLLIAADALEKEEGERLLFGMRRSADFLCHSNEKHGFISNHRIGAACALVSLFQITGEDRYQTRADDLMAGVLSKASKDEGWLFEYTGADPGYQTLATYYLANYIRLTGSDKTLYDWARKSVAFLQYFLHPDGSIGGDYGSRNCPLFFPAGLELLAKHFPEAEAIVAQGAIGIKTGHSPNLCDTDIRNFVPLLSSYVQAMLVSVDGNNVKSAMLPYKRTFERFWPEAGLYVHSNSNFYSVVGCSKGGVVKVFSKNGKCLIARLSGYMAQLISGEFLSTQFQKPIEVSGTNHCIGRETPTKSERSIKLVHPIFSVAQRRTASPWQMVLFRLYTLAIGRNLWFADWIKRKVITARFIHRR